ncbi:MAG: glycosyltransferase family 2 protein [Lachnospiraceae bacterium]
MKKNPLVSVIVPAYNAEASIENCLNSIINQTYKELEIIVINDGSVDNTKEVLHKYEVFDARIVVKNIANSGVSSARNLALSIANGELIQFVDSDDWIAKEATQMLVNAMMNNCELVISDYTRVFEKTEIIRGHIKRSGAISCKEFALEMMKAPANFYYGVLWNKLYKASVIKKYQLSFAKEMQWCEDFQFNLEYLQHVKNIYVLQTPLYFYVKTKGSLTSLGTDVKEIVNMKTTIFQDYKALYQSMDLYNDNKFKIKRFYVDFARDHIKKLKVIKGVGVEKAKKRSYKLKKKEKK